jgi:hypothetical protein
MAKAKEAAQRLLDRGGRTLSKLPHILHILPPDQSDQSSNTATSPVNPKTDVKESDKVINEDELVRQPNESEEEFLIRNCR